MNMEVYSMESFVRRSVHERIEEEECFTTLSRKYPSVRSVRMESRFYVEYDKSLNNGLPLDEKQMYRILTNTWDVSYFQKESYLKQDGDHIVLEVGPRLNFRTPYSTNCVNICASVGLNFITRIEKARRYKIYLSTLDQMENVVRSLFDQMTEQVYPKILTTLSTAIPNTEWTVIDIKKGGALLLKEANVNFGFGFDEEEIQSYYELFMEMGRNPTTVELHDLAQSNSEHSRHWFFKGKYILDGEECESSLMEMVAATNRPKNTNTNDNNVIKFNDNSSGIKGSRMLCMIRGVPENCSKYQHAILDRDIILTAETHNFPTGVAPFSGATTGTGGRIRDIQATGRGGRVIAGTAGYCFGNLNIPGYEQPWETQDTNYPTNFATPLEIAIQASNGASDYGNKFGEPVITGFARSFGMTTYFEASGITERREWIKPIMFSAGIGSIDRKHIKKDPAKIGQYIMKVGGPAYRIGVGGGAASSTEVQGDSSLTRDLMAVQRGDPEMEQKMNRVIMGCIEKGSNCPIGSIHDQGAGGNANVLKELIEDSGGIIFAHSFSRGDPSLSVADLWIAEYQESNALLVDQDKLEILQRISQREKCPIDRVGYVTSNKKVQLVESTYYPRVDPSKLENLPVNLDLESVCHGIPQKIFKWTSKVVVPCIDYVELNPSLIEALERVLRLPSVSSKRYLTNKVDRSVSGLVAQQQCCGPSHMPLADVAVVALSHFTEKGAATSIGEQPIKMLVNPRAGARMSVIEALTNLCSAKITDIKDIKCSANWMWPAKLPGEGAELYFACEAMCDIMQDLGIGVDGGKDSLSMATRVPPKDSTSKGDIVKSPGSLVISAYAPCPDVKKVVTPDLKVLKEDNSETVLILVRPTIGKARLGGTALMQAYAKRGSESPDLDKDEVQTFIKLFNALQDLIENNKILAMHDISDGGLITCILEMAMAGQVGVSVDLPPVEDNNVFMATGEVFSAFNEETGWVIQTTQRDLVLLKEHFADAGISQHLVEIGKVTTASVNEKIRVSYKSILKLEIPLKDIIRIYEETSFQIEKLQMNTKCAEMEYELLQMDCRSEYYAPFEWLDIDSPRRFGSMNSACVAIIREEGTNGDREMAAAFMQSGFCVFDVTMTDILAASVDLNKFQGLVFPGGFSYADVLGSAAGWALSILEQKHVLSQFIKWAERSDTFSLGICNGCQLMARLGWIGEARYDLKGKTSPTGRIFERGKYMEEPTIHLLPNLSGRFESRWSRLKIKKTKSIFFKDMEDSILGCWVAHGEGRFDYKTHSVKSKMLNGNLVAVEYVDPEGKPTTQYPFNPNGSEGGVAGVISFDGRHMAMMPHPERAFVSWQWPEQGSFVEWPQKASPWARMFQNAYDWCLENRSE